MRSVILFICFSLFQIHHSIAQTFNWAKGLGGTMNDQGYALAADAQGNVFGACHFENSADLNPGPEEVIVSGGGTLNVGVYSLDSSGNFRWGYGFGSNGFNFGRDIAVDHDGAVYITGDFQGTIDFNPGEEVFNLTANGGTSIFVLKLSNIGEFLWARSFGGLGIDIGNGIAISPLDEVYVCGKFYNDVDFNPGGTPLILTSTSEFEDAFILKLNSSGQTQWAYGIGGSSIDAAVSVSTDALGNVLCTGYFSGSCDFQTNGTETVNRTSQAGSEDVFVLKTTANGDYLWVQTFGGNNIDWPYALCSDGNNNVFVSGFFRQTVDFNPGIEEENLSSAGMNDAFVVKFNSSGNFQWVRKFGSSDMDGAAGLQCDAAGNIVVSGSFASTVDFDPGAANFPLSAAGGRDVFVIRLDGNGIFHNALRFGASGDDTSEGLAISPSGDVFITGRFWGTVDFNPPVDQSLSSSGSAEIYVVKYELDCLAPNIFLNNDQLIASLSGASYQWFDCSSGLTAIEGAISSSYSPAQEGNYAVAVYSEFCSDTSSCFNYSTAGFSNLVANPFQLFPNPSEGPTFLYSADRIEANIFIYDLKGRLIIERSMGLEIGQNKLEFSGISKGMYLLQVRSRLGTHHLRFVKN